MTALPIRALLAFVPLLASSPSWAAELPDPPTVELTAEASAEAVNDLATAQAYFEATGSAPAALATEVNRTIAAALDIARGYPAVKVRSAGSHTGPIYGSGGISSSRAKIEGWRMRSTLSLESRDVAAMSALIGRLQGSLAVAELNFAPARETRQAAEDKALVTAIGNFNARAKLAADTLGKGFRIRQLSIRSDGSQPPVPVYRAAIARADSAPAPVEAGETSVRVQVSGTIELLD